MYIGHIAMGLAAKRWSPRTSLPILFAAAYFIDLIFPFLVWAGIESVHIAPGKSAFTPLDFAYYPYSHSLLMALVWALAFALTYRLWRGDRRGTWMVFALVLSHWVLDFVSHVPDLPLAPGVEFKVGLGLWNSKLATVFVEGALFFAGVVIYLLSTCAARARGTIVLWAFLLFIALSYLGNLSSPPPNTTVLLVAIFSSWLYLPWLAWVERNRRLVPGLDGKGDPRRFMSFGDISDHATNTSRPIAQPGASSSRNSSVRGSSM